MKRKTITSVMCLVLMTITLFAQNNRKAINPDIDYQKVTRDTVYKESENHDLLEIVTSKQLLEHGTHTTILPINKSKGETTSKVASEKSYKEYRLIEETKILCRLPEYYVLWNSQGLDNFVKGGELFGCAINNYQLSILCASIYEKVYTYHNGTINFKIARDRASIIFMHILMFLVFLTIFMIIRFIMKRNTRDEDDKFSVILLTIITGSFTFIAYSARKDILLNPFNWLNLINIGLVCIFWIILRRIYQKKKREMLDN